MCLFLNSTVNGEETQNVLIFHGASDASASVAINDNMFIVADDEDNVLRIYRMDIRGASVSSYNLKAFLNVEPEQPEADIEGATMIGRRIYWITSHGRNKEGKIRSSRYRFFATDIEVMGQKVIISPVGRPCETLVHELVKSEAGRSLELEKVTRLNINLKKKDREKLAPKEEGLNIEALSASAEGGTIYIGFRNPRPSSGMNHKQHTLIVPLQNASEIIENGRIPVFGRPILWDYQGLGIRSMEYSRFHGAYFIIAGVKGDDNGDFLLYRWSGNKDEEPVLVRKLDLGGSEFTPEALIPFERSGKLLLLSDDGSIPVEISGPHECAKGQYREDGTCQNKYLLDSERKTFRGIWIRP
jgi:hypothetical protein